MKAKSLSFDLNSNQGAAKLLLQLPVGGHAPFKGRTSPRVLLEKIIVSQLVKKFSIFYGTRCPITVFTRDSDDKMALELVPKAPKQSMQNKCGVMRS
jgi:hypothetical protein